MIHFSEAASLALHSMIIISADTDDGLTSVKRIGTVTGASQAHLAKVMQRLVKSGLVRSVRGPKGGFALNRPRSDITLLEIYEAMEGPLAAGGCLLKKESCPAGFRNCALSGLLGDLTVEARRYLAGKTLEDLQNDRRR